ncbi:MAG: endonuclease domain-containing protein [Chloroherpetonaceae bacterium]|nr:endonuclease domain-containing protein [Chloroherpetonaceae bacterium]
MPQAATSLSLQGEGRFGTSRNRVRSAHLHTTTTVILCNAVESLINQAEYMTKRVFNRTEVKDLRRKLRQNQTEAEAIFWNCVRDRRLANCKFRRQYSVERFVIDFYAPEVRLAIELDGGVHFTDEAQARDKAREDVISQYEISFLRFTNSDIKLNLQAVLEAVRIKVEELRLKEKNIMILGKAFLADR